MLVGPGRLQWVYADNGFVAHPDGDERPDRSARLSPLTLPAGAWNWSLSYDLARAGGVADSRQKASDAANLAWGQIKDQAVRLAHRAAWEHRQLELMDRAEVGEFLPATFGFETADYDDLIWTMNLACKRPESRGLAKLITALSREFYRRRTE